MDHDIPLMKPAGTLPTSAQASITTATPFETFVIQEVKGYKKQPQWSVNLTASQAEFTCLETNRQLLVPRDKARAEIKFTSTGLFNTNEGTTANVSGTTFNFGVYKSRLERWFPPVTARDMQKELQGWGFGLIFMGVLSIIFSSFLDPVWGGVIIVLGIVNLLVNNRVMFVFNGLALLIVGGLNILSLFMVLSSSYGGYSSFSTGWVIYGIMQISWGFKEIGKFSKYGNVRS